MLIDYLHVYRSHNMSSLHTMVISRLHFFLVFYYLFIYLLFYFFFLFFWELKGVKTYEGNNIGKHANGVQEKWKTIYYNQKSNLQSCCRKPSLGIIRYTRQNKTINIKTVNLVINEGHKNRLILNQEITKRATSEFVDYRGRWSSCKSYEEQNAPVINRSFPGTALTQASFPASGERSPRADLMSSTLAGSRTG